MFRKRSRSNPGSSRSASPGPLDLNMDGDNLSIVEISEEDVLPPPHIEAVVIDQEENGPKPNDLNIDADLNPDIQYAYTARHPLGNILLKLLNENTKLADKVNMRSMDLSVQDLCTQFYNAQLMEKQKIKSKIMQTTQGLENLILSKEMDSHTLNQSVAPPTNFSPAPTLVTARQRADCLKLLPASKFSGSEKGMSILEFLNLMKSVQQQCCLSLSEFYEILLASTTGEAYLLLLAWIENGDDPSTIFHNLLIHYDKRLKPEEARMRLMAYRAPKSADLGKVEATIQSLAARVASNIPAGPSRTASYNIEVIQGLIRSLPLASSLIVQTQNSEKSAKFGRALSAAELSRFLNIYRHSIDSDIKTNGVDSRTFERRPLPRAGNIGGRKFTAYQTSGVPPLPRKTPAPQMVRTRSVGQIYQVSQNYKPRPPGGNKILVRDNQYNNNNFMRKKWSNGYGTRNNNNGNNNYNNNGMNRNINRKQTDGFRGSKIRMGTASRRPFNNGRQNPNYNRNYCSLCGQTSHLAVQGCPNMVSDSGVKVPVLPTKDTCKECPPHVNPRLSHPPSICPYRKNGPWGKL